MSGDKDIQFTVPKVTFKTRVKDETIEGENPYKWQDVECRELFKNKKCLVVALPGAFTPTCTTKQLPGFEEKYDEFKKLGVDEIYCLSVNDAFVMHKWAESLNIKKVKMLPDGNGHFTRQMGMLVEKQNLGFGLRSWRYVALINNNAITTLWIENGIEDNKEGDPYEISTPQNILNWFIQQKLRTEV
tara:strand:+ start:765 stop:1325 length:561 start_codon:yes stop_codon:yes gene_type:complete